MGLRNGRSKVLVCASISEPSIALLHQCAEVDVREGISAGELLDVIAGYEALVVDSELVIDAGVIERANRLRVIGGIDSSLGNVDLLAAKNRGISIVAGAVSDDGAAMDAARDVALARRLTDLMGEIDSLMSLQVVEARHVFAHESVDPRRVAQLADWLTAEGRLLHPPLVTSIGGGYVILDGATRIAALKRLGFRHVIVQVVDDVTRITLYAWHHVLRHRQPADLLERLRQAPAVTWRPARSEEMNGADSAEEPVVCLLETAQGERFEIVAAEGIDALDAANEFSDLYGRLSHVSRTVGTDMDALRQEYTDIAALVRYPHWKIGDVLDVAKQGKVLPAGITRFVIPGRVLRLNVDLERLASDQPLADKNEWLLRLLLDKKAGNRIRYYREPVYLLDD